MPTLKTVTFGCKVNQYETEYVRQGLQLAGYRDAVEGETVDLCVVNSCTVTAEAEAQSRKFIRRLARQHPQVSIVVMGCYATRNPVEVASLPAVVDVVTDKRDLPNLLRRFGVGEPPVGLTQYQSRQRAVIKVQDGCAMNCAYCIIPSVRPVLSSRPIAEVVDEVTRQVAAGHGEVVLTGIHLGHYGFEGGRRSALADLVEALVALPGQFRLRLSSVEAAEVTPRLLELMASNPRRLCPHLHVPLQHGSDAVLERMRRRYTFAEFAECVSAIRRWLPRAAISTDVIVGFPGETEDDFAVTCRRVEELAFSRVHVFRFSPRKGTDAAGMPNQVPDRVRLSRATQLGGAAQLVAKRYAASLLGGMAQVMAEEAVPDRPGWLQGTSGEYVTVWFASPEQAIGRLFDVRITEAVGDTLLGTAGLA